MECHSVGWLVSESADRVVIVAHVQAPDEDNPQVDGVMTIPKVAVTEMLTLMDASV